MRFLSLLSHVSLSAGEYVTQAVMRQLQGTSASLMYLSASDKVQTLTFSVGKNASNSLSKIK